MRTILFILSLIVTPSAFAQEDTYTYGGNGYEIELSEKPAPVKQVKPLPKKIIKRKPAQEKPVVVTPSEPEARVALTTAYYKGGIYFGGEKVPAEFSYVGVDLLFPSDGWSDFGLSAGYLFNKSAVKVFSGNMYFGYKLKINEQFTFRVGPTLGLSSYNEKTNVQQVSAFGLQFGAKVQVDYTLKSGLYLGAGLNWRHDMFASTFWGKDPFSDVVLDFIGPQLTLGWKF